MLRAFNSDSEITLIDAGDFSASTSVRVAVTTTVVLTGGMDGLSVVVSRDFSCASAIMEVRENKKIPYVFICDELPLRCTSIYWFSGNNLDKITRLCYSVMAAITVRS